ncbi:MAG: serine/threonine protein kinase, partial [Cyanobacteria bacterium]|nr:serine/threonine protein kinase [Cyanobacteriota bacterium]
MSDPNKRCPKCGGEVAPASHGSITQWIAACSCIDSFSGDAEDAQTVQICADCGKRVNPGRAGSFTQWIFRLDTCSCETPRVVQQRVLVAAPPSEEAPLVDESLEPALEIDPGRFPVERYKPISIIGKGGSGTVYYCRDRLLNKIVAVKTLHSLTRAQLVSFQREAKATSSLNHPHIVQILDFGITDGGAPFMAMEYIDGINLEDYLLENGPLPLTQVIEIFTRVCSGLSFAHGMGILHRDIKSSNLLLKVTDGVAEDVRLIDFGVSAKVPGGQQESGGIDFESETVVGSPLYMPPDATRGLAYDERSEIYGLGCSLFEALTGRTPFEGLTALDTLRKHAQEPSPSLSAFHCSEEFTEALEKVIAKTLAKEKNERFQSMRDLGIALRSLSPEPEVYLAESNIHRPTPSSPKSFWLVKIGLCLAAVLAIVFGARVLYKSRSFGQSKPVVAKEVMVNTREITDVLSRAAEGHFFEAKLPSGRWRLRARGTVSDQTLKTVRGRKDIESINLLGDDVTD